VRGNLQALFGKRLTEKGPAKGTSPAVDFTLRAAGGEIPPADSPESWLLRAGLLESADGVALRGNLA